jgi:hypothetical protein
MLSETLPISALSASFHLVSLARTSSSTLAVMFANKRMLCFLQVIKNFHLYGLLFALLAVDCLLLTVWMVISPYKSEVLELPSEVMLVFTC